MVLLRFFLCIIFFFKQKTAYEMRISDWSSDVCSSDLIAGRAAARGLSSVGAGPDASHRRDGGDFRARRDFRDLRRCRGVDAAGPLFRQGRRPGSHPCDIGRARAAEPDAVRGAPAALSQDRLRPLCGDDARQCGGGRDAPERSEEHTSELQSLMRISYAVFCLKKKTL